MHKKKFYGLWSITDRPAGYTPNTKLVDGNNLERAPLTFQHAAVKAENAHVNVMQLMPVSESHGDASLPTGTLPQSNSHPPASPSLVSSCRTSPTPSDGAPIELESDTPLVPTGTKHHWRHPVIPSDNDSEEHENPENAPKKKKKQTHATRENGKCT